jgi:hypothetical protein
LAIIEGYQCSTDGNFRNKKKPDYLMSTKPGPDGYVRIGFVGSNGRTKMRLAHRVVALTFLTREIHQTVVNHIDGNTGNNRVENLEWCTQKQNCQNKRTRKQDGNNHAVLQYSLQGIFIQEWSSVTEASKGTNVSIPTISACCRKRTKRCSTFVWRYKDDEDLEGEIWKEIKGRRVSNFGRFECLGGRKTYGTITGAGYRGVDINQRSYYLHVLICKAFHGKRPSKSHTVNHINFNKLDDREENLEWADFSKQNKHKRTNVDHKQDRIDNLKKFTDICKPIAIRQTIDISTVSRINRRLVKSIDNKGNETRYKSIAEASRATGIHRSGISRCCDGTQTYVIGSDLKWQYCQQ